MKKGYAVFEFLSEANKKHMSGVAAENGCEIGIYESTEEAMGRLSDGEFIYCDEPSLLADMPLLKWCHSASAGVGKFIDCGVFDSGDVVLTNSSGSYGLVISEYIIMTTLMLMRRIPEYEEIIDRREWRMHLPVRSIAGSRIAIIGTGNLGRNAARRFKALGAANVTGMSRSGRPAEDFDEVFKVDEFEKVVGGRDFDVLVLCVPGTPDSEGLLSRERIALLSEKTFVINVGRGMVIDQDALIDALNEGRIAGAALDVVYPEPLPEDHPLWTTKNLILTPHMSGDMGLPYTVDQTVEIFCDNLRRFARGGELTHVVDIKAGY